MAILRTAALASALVLGLVGSASAVPIIPSQTIVSGNITFDNFICSSINSGRVAAALT